MKKERWKPVPGYVGYYEVSEYGRVRSLDRTIEVIQPYGLQRKFIPGRILKAGLNKGYAHVTLGVGDGLPQILYVHRLVALAFIGEAPFDGAR